MMFDEQKATMYMYVSILKKRRSLGEQIEDRQAHNLGREFSYQFSVFGVSPLVEEKFFVALVQLEFGGLQQLRDRFQLNKACLQPRFDLK